MHKLSSLLWPYFILGKCIFYFKKPTDLKHLRLMETFFSFGLEFNLCSIVCMQCSYQGFYFPVFRLPPQRVTWPWHWTATCVAQFYHYSQITVSSSWRLTMCPLFWNLHWTQYTGCQNVNLLPKARGRWFQISWLLSQSTYFL